MTEINNTNDALRVLHQRFEIFDGADEAVQATQGEPERLHEVAREYANGVIAVNDLEAAATGAGFTEEEQAAAQYLLDHPETLGQIDGAADGGHVDDKMRRGDVYAFINTHRSTLSYDVVAAADANAILQAGERDGQDDYDTRVLALAQRAGELSPEQGQTLIREILRQDRGAPDSWLQLDRLQRLQSDGVSQVPASSFTAVEDAIASTPAGVQQLIGGDVVDHVGTYSEYADELNWLVANLGPSMTPEQLEQAIDGYIRDKNEDDPGWQQRYEDAQQQAIDDGRQLLERFGALDPQAMRPEDREELLNAILEDHPEARTAVLLALNDPAAVDADTLNAALGFFDGIELSGRAPELASALGQAYLAKVRTTIEAVDPSDPATVQAARTAIENLRNSHYAGLLDLRSTEFNAVIDALDGTVPDGRISVSEMEQRLQRLSAASDRLDTVSDRAGITQGLRALGFASGAIGLYASGSELLNDPSNLEAAGRTLTDLLGLGNTAAEALNAAGRGGSFAARLGSPGLGKLLGAAGLVFGVVDLYRNLGDGDYAQAGFTAAGIAGTALATFGTASWAGPVGIGIGALAVAGSIGLNQWRKVDASNEHMNPVSREFLQHAGLDEAVAGALVDQSGDGYSPVPFLFAYAESRGLTQAQAIEWLNSLSGGELESIRDRAHEVLDEVDGDLSAMEGDADQATLDFLAEYARAKQDGSGYTYDQGNYFELNGESRVVTAGTWDEFDALLEAKGRPVASA